MVAGIAGVAGAAELSNEALHVSPAGAASSSRDTALSIEKSLTGRRWVWRPGSDRLSAGLAERLGVPELIGRLLDGRGVTLDEAAGFLEPTLRASLPDPSAIIDMDIAAARLAAAVQAKACVGIFGDYDVDGACASALMVTVLRRLGCEVVHHVPDRIREGYGPNTEALRGMVALGASLLICVDCGTTAHDALAPLHNQTDILIFDHHKCVGVPPAVTATVNPNRLDCSSGLTGICATAVAFLACVALLRRLRQQDFFAARDQPDLLELLDLVALATICDMMPLTGLNRALVAQGLRVMAKRGRPGIAALLEVAAIQEFPSVVHCGFALGPRINAAGRIAEADMGLRLLLSDEMEEARRLALSLDGLNRQRQDVEAGVLAAAMAEAEAQISAGLPVILVAQPGWHPGVVGIVAGRLKEKFNRPALVGGITDGVVKGSGRSVAGLDLGTLVIAARQAGLLLGGGGHAMAVGFSLEADRLGAFHALLIERMAGALALPVAADLTVDGVVAADGGDIELAEMIRRLGPFGIGNEEPLFVLPRVRVIKSDRIGKDGGTLRMMLEGEGGGRIKALLFRGRGGELAEALSRTGGAPLHLAGYFRAERWNGRSSASFFIADAALA